MSLEIYDCQPARESMSRPLGDTLPSTVCLSASELARAEITPANLGVIACDSVCVEPISGNKRDFVPSGNPREIPVDIQKC